MKSKATIQLSCKQRSLYNPCITQLVFSDGIFRNHGTPIIETVTSGANFDRFDSAPPTVCRVLGETIDLSKCNQPDTTQSAGAYLKIDHPKVKAEYSVGVVFPPLAAALFGIPWKLIFAHASSLEPFHQVARPRDGRMSSLLRRYESNIGALYAPLPAVSLVAKYLSAAVGPLAVASWKIGLEGSCDKDKNDGCTPVVVVWSPAVRVLEAVLALHVVLAIALVAILGRWTTGLQADPRSIIGVASLSHSPGFLRLFNSYPEVGGWLGWKAERRHLSKTRLQYTASQGDFGIVVREHEEVTAVSVIAGEKPDRAAAQQPHHCAHKMPAGNLAALIVFALGLVAFMSVIMYYGLTPDDHPLGRFLSSQTPVGPRIVFSVVGVIINFLWVEIFTSRLPLVLHSL